MIDFETSSDRIQFPPLPKTRGPGPLQVVGGFGCCFRGTNNPNHRRRHAGAAAAARKQLKAARSLPVLHPQNRRQEPIWPAQGEVVVAAVVHSQSHHPKSILHNLTMRYSAFAFVLFDGRRIPMILLFSFYSSIAVCIRILQICFFRY